MLKRISDFDGFEGFIEIDLGKYRQRMIELSSLSLTLNDDGQVDIKSVNLAKEVTKLYDIIHSKVKSMELKHLESGTVFTSLDELENYHEYIAVMQKLITIYNQGESLGNSLSKK
jgi:hypothetical protein